MNDTVESIADRLASLGDHPPTIDEFEKWYILAVLDRYGWDKPAAAESLGINLKTLYNKLNRLRPDLPSRSVPCSVRRSWYVG